MATPSSSAFMIFLWFFKKRSVLSRRKQQSAFDPSIRVRQRKDSGLPRLSFKEIGSRVRRNQATVMRICDRWMQEGTMDRRG
ncbi:hypothetical protein TNCV_4542921 [Trichonephila clavipes]|nr:hypothetical protein TNCV_4542921 [Trichonephila clavipes]